MRAREVAEVFSGAQHLHTTAVVATGLSFLNQGVAKGLKGKWILGINFDKVRRWDT